MSDEKNSIRNYADQEAIKKLQELVDDIRIGMLCTNLRRQPVSTCPMSTQKVEDDGSIWFFSLRSSDHNRDIAADNRVQLLYANPEKVSFVSVYGTAEILYDRAKIEEYWSPLAKTWFQQGKDDPDLTLIRVKPEESYYWDTKNGKMVAFLKMAASVVSGKTMDDGVQGKLRTNTD
jgi:general stress protein 26